MRARILMDRAGVVVFLVAQAALLGCLDHSEVGLDLKENESSAVTTEEGDNASLDSDSDVLNSDVLDSDVLDSDVLDSDVPEKDGLDTGVPEDNVLEKDKLDTGVCELPGDDCPSAAVACARRNRTLRGRRSRIRRSH